MKRFFTLLLTLAMVFALAGCGAAPAGVETAAASGPAVVTTVDELLAAIAPGAEIQLVEGEYLLSDAANYGKSESEYYAWNDLGLGEYELLLHNVTDLTIVGAGKGLTTLKTANRWANVISMKDCRNVTLKSMTLGHTEMTQACEGGVIRLEGCEDTKLHSLGLYGCGTLGVLAFQSEGLDMYDCAVYECSIGGVQISKCRQVAIRDSAFHDMGKDMPVQHVFSVFESEHVTVEDCAIYDNYVETMIYAHGGVTFRSNRFTGNRVSSAAFTFYAPGVVLDGNEFAENELRNWYTMDSAHAVDAAGEEVVFEAPAEETRPLVPGETVPVSTGEQKQVRVTNADDFLGAIGPDTCVILDVELLDLSTAQSYQNAEKAFAYTDEFQPVYREEYMPYCYWMDNHDGPSLVISGVSNLTIRAEGEDRMAHTVSAVPRYADVLTFENCSAITLSGFTAGHTIAPGQCTGGVFLLNNCEDVLIDNCGMYGCGTEGVNGQSSRNIQIVNSEIYECSYTGIELYECENVAISGTVIRDIRNDFLGEAPYFRFYGSKNVTLDGTPLDGNYIGN